MKYLFIALTTLTLSLNAQIITTVCGNGTAGYSGDGGQATNADLNFPLSITIDVSGNFYFSDNDNQRIRKVNTAGIITTIAGNGTAGYSGDGGPATAAELHTPIGVVFDAFGNLYMADAANHRIRKINPSGIISTIAGTGTNGYSGDGGAATAAELGQPRGLAFDAMGNLYFADGGYDVIRKVNSLGIITTIVGNGTQGYSGDGGQATAAELYWPWGIAFDLMGNMYIADEGNGRVRLVNTSGIISTVAGYTATGGYSGDGGQATAAEFADVMNVVVDASGNIYVSDNNNGRVRKINTLGIIITIAGNGGSGFSGMGGQATAAELAGPNGLVLDALGNLFFIDEESNHICKVTNVASIGIEQAANINEQITIYPNPATNSIQVSLANSENTMIVIRDMLGNTVYHSTANTLHNTIPIAEFANGVYIIDVSNSKGSAFKKVIKE